MNVALLLALILCLVALAIELRRGTIPNWLTFSSLVAGPALVTVLDGVMLARQPSALTFGMAYFHAIGGAIFAAWIPVLLWRRDALGGGAVKLTAAVAAVTCDSFLGLMMGLVWAAVGAFGWWARSRRPQEELRTFAGSAVVLVAFVIATIATLVRP